MSLQSAEVETLPFVEAELNYLAPVGRRCRSAVSHVSAHRCTYTAPPNRGKSR